MRLQTMRAAGAVVRRTRLELNWSQQRLADEAGVSREWVSALERGKASLDMRLYLDVTDALGLELSVQPRQEGRA